MKLWTLAMGAGMAAGAVAIMMMPRNSAVRQMVSDTAEKVEDAVSNAVGKMTSEINF